MRHINLSTVRFEYGTIDEAKAKGFDVENNNGMSIIPSKEFSDTYFVTPEAAERGTDNGVYLLIKTSEFIKDAAIMTDFAIKQNPEKALNSISSFMNAMAEAMPQVINAVKEQFAQTMAEVNKSAEPQAEAEENNDKPADTAEESEEKKNEDSFEAVDE